MSERDDQETITVAEVSSGTGGTADVEPGTAVSLPVVEVLTGRGFVTGKSGSGKSNTASVVVENLLDGGFPVLVVDADGEYYGLKEDYEVLHAGADEECDIRVRAEHAEKLATLALEENVPIVLDVSGYLDADEAKEIVLETARHLFAKEKKLKKPFLLLIEECHEYIPEGGGLDETGKMLIKIGKRGRKHGLGIVGISQRPADVKKDFITQCDWLVWHRLTWNNDTAVVSRILGSEYGDAVEDLGDGEAFLTTDWGEDVRRVQFHRKKTFDAGATPGLDDVERPELKSVSGDLVSELQDISDEQQRRESELADLRAELDRKRQRIEDLERELEEARDLSQMADKFAGALLQKAEASYRGGAIPEGNQATLPETARRDQPGTSDSDESSSVETTESIETTESTERSERPEDDDNADDNTDDNTGVGRGERRGDDERNGDSERVEDGTRGRETDRALAFARDVELGTREAMIDQLRSRIERLGTIERAMLDHYRTDGPATPIEVHVAAGGDGDRSHAYSRNRTLRQAGLIRHAGRGQYDYALPALIRTAYDGQLDEDAIADMVATVEESIAEVPDATRQPTTERAG